MSRFGRLAILLAPLTAPIAAAPLSVVKSSAVASDPQGNVLPKRVPGAMVDYTTTITNPNNVATAVNGIVFADAIPANTILSVSDLSLLSGPVVFTEGIPPSLLSYTFASLGSTSDRLDFSSDNGVTWTYIPRADANGCDSSVTNIRVRLGGSQVTGSSFSLRFRVMVK